QPQLRRRIDENAPPRRLHENGATITMIARVGRGTDGTFTTEHRHAGGCAGAEKGESTGGHVGFYSAARARITYRWEFAGTALAGLISSPRCANGTYESGRLSAMGNSQNDPNGIQTGMPPKTPAHSSAIQAGSPSGGAGKGSIATGAPSFSHMMLFWASFFTLIAAGMGFSI